MGGWKAMAELPLSRPPESAAAGRDVLLTTKLHLPRTRPGFVPRPRLAGRLAHTRGGELMLVCAPAGFGKTALVADWARRRQRPVAWLSLDEGDNDPTRFWRHVAAALDRVRPGIAERAAALLQGLQPASSEAVVTSLVNELDAVAEEVVLVLDDYHLIQAPPVHQSLAFLLEHLPACLHLVVASRADPPLPLARLRARGQLAEVREGDLRFTPEETAALLRAAVGPDLLEAAVAVLGERTEGWAAGLQLAALSLHGHADPAGFVATFSGSQRYVLDYLAEEVLDRQPEPLRAFLLETSVLERLSGELCDAVTGRTDGQQLLEQVERANLFLVPLDEVRGWWRYHHLFADLLRARLEQERPERVAGLHRAAVAWCEQHGLVDDAVRHGLAAGDTWWAARLLERHLDRLLLQGEGATLQRWLGRLPAELAGSRPRLLLAQARLALIGGHPEAVESLLNTAQRRFAAAADEPYEPSVGRAASLMANVPATIALDRAFLALLRGDAEQVSAFARQGLAEIGEGEWMLETYARGYLAVAEWLGGRLIPAERGFASTIARWRAAGERFLAVRLAEFLGLAQRGQGHLEAALGTYQQALEDVTVPGRPALPAAGIARVGMAGVLYERDQLDAALQHVTEGIALCRRLAYTQSLATGLATLAWIRQATGDPAGALEAIEAAGRVAPGPSVANLLNPVPAQRARLLLTQGDLAAATRWTRQRGLGADDEVRYPREGEYLLLARVLLAHDRPDQALGLLERLHAQAAAQARTGSVIEARALQALALVAAGEETSALAVLAEAVALGAPEGYLRVYVDEGTPMAALLGKLTTAGTAPAAAAGDIPPDELARLAQAFAGDGLPVGQHDGRAGVVPGLVEPLSDRELQVLRLVAAGRSNQQIADELVVVLDTVKKHVGHLLAKLGAANRTQAVARARELGLLQ
jgi:LuxR family transcriptional regulator, maltose regulon positive regulatory protein